ncbi:Serine-threonine/tyrosine-protein kinase catalytic domain [Arabidopsis thaliana x Arabidopsis arenosa]|uniref:non-specific serine/threonine protein kinase n=1 Tax=Arabidopsis thaliana x Arabidopsis arenosa TaxID=1240361 RepID=A0A8T2AR14_9BRAS|nr:Serine-threonine/tyrosine-protein kinase catalytic domain [Arabidopsis thaliana x Arabidopsis arenosa]KAG7576553.1 Serine-threonine/tyrosine-protein kinase catalytic domain [Arabidopsis thaliana x Arabidopsis arenosa]
MRYNCFGLFDMCKGSDRLGQREAEEICTNNVRVFSYNSLRSATDGFHPTKRIGGGGYGVVFKGVLRDGTQVAVKSLSAESKQGTREFLTEINLISNIHHPNLVNLIGCCIEGKNRILVYEYLENNSLASVLLGSRSRYVPLDWSKRAAICVGTASGLAFLHEEVEPQVVHRDIKASNILLDQNFSPKIGDFGLAKLFPDNVTHVSTRVAGTVGYLAPEYALLGQLTKKADVYSFGILVLEVISGNSSTRAAFGDDYMVLVEWVWKLREERRLLECVDPDLTKFPEDEVTRFIKVALFCTQAAAQKRPNMKQVVEMLCRKELNLNEDALTEPGVYRGVNKGRNHRGIGLIGGQGGSSQESSSTQRYKGKSSAVPQGSTSTSNISIQSITEVAPR